MHSAHALLAHLIHALLIFGELRRESGLWTFERPVHPRVSARMQAETASGKAGKAVLFLVCSQKLAVFVTYIDVWQDSV